MASLNYIRDTSKDTVIGNPTTVYTDSTTLTTGMTLYDNTGTDTGLVVGTVNQDGTFDIVQANTTIISFSDSNDPLLVSYIIDGTTYTGSNNIRVTNNETHTFSGLCNGDRLLVNELTVSYYYGGSLPKNIDCTFVTDGSTITFTGNETLTFSVSDVMAFSVGGCCVPYYSKVLYNDGSVQNAEDVKIGDVLLGYNEESKQYESVEVLGIIHKVRRDIVKIIFDDDTYLELTPDHPVLTNKGWACYNPEISSYKKAINSIIKLTTDQKVLSTNNNYKQIKEIKLNMLDNPIDVYTYDVTNTINTFIADNCVIHNEPC